MIDQLLGIAGPMVGDYAASRNAISGPDPHTLDMRSRVMMSPQMFAATYDPSYRDENPTNAALHAYRNRFQPQVSTPYLLGQQYGPSMVRGTRDVLGGLFSTGTVPSALISALIGGGAGYLGAAGLNKFTNNYIDPKLAAIIGGTSLAGIGALGGHTYKTVRNPQPFERTPYMSPYVPRDVQQSAADDILNSMGSMDRGDIFGRSKQRPRDLTPDEIDGVISHHRSYSDRGPYIKGASWRDDEQNDFRGHIDARDKILNILRMQSPSDFATLQGGIMRLSPSQAQDLLKVISFTGGAYAGQKIAQFLMGAGLLSRVAGAVVGGILGSRLFSGGTPNPRTATGQILGRFI